MEETLHIYTRVSTRVKDDDGIEYVDAEDKSAGYEIVEGGTGAPIVIPCAATKNRYKDARKVGRQEQNAKKSRWCRGLC